MLFPLLNHQSHTIWCTVCTPSISPTWISKCRETKRAPSPEQKTWSRPSSQGSWHQHLEGPRTSNLPNLSILGSLPCSNRSIKKETLIRRPCCQTEAANQDLLSTWRTREYADDMEKLPKFVKAHTIQSAPREDMGATSCTRPTSPTSKCWLSIATF